MASRPRIAIIGGGSVGRAAAGYAAGRGAEVMLVTTSLSAQDRLDAGAVRLLAREAQRVSEAWEPEGPSPGAEYAPALRETLIGALDLSSANYESETADLRRIQVRLVEGFGRIEAPDIVDVDRPDGRTERIPCCAIILATGAEAVFGKEDSSCVITSRTMRSIEEVPESLIVLGSSPSALELALFFSAFGVSVTLVGGRRPALHFLDQELRDKVVETAMDNNIRVITEATAVTGTANDGVDVLLSDDTHIDEDCVLPCGEGLYRTDGLNLEGPGVRTGPDGEILVDDHMRTNIPEIFAVGSITGRFGTNIALRQAQAAVENALGGDSGINYDLIPTTAEFDPEIGVVGLSADEADYAGRGASTSITCTDGAPRRTKLIADESTGRVLGLQAVGDGAVEAVQSFALAMHCGVTLDDAASLACTQGTMSACISTAARRIAHPAQTAQPLVSGPE